LALFSGVATLNDGSPSLVLNPSGLADALDLSAWSDGGVDDPRPAHRSPEAAIVTPTEEAAEGGRTRLLVIESTMPLRRMLDRTLTRAGYEVHFAATLDEALAALLRSPEFDGALADLEQVAPSAAWTRGWDKLRKTKSFRLLALASHNGESVQSVARQAGFAVVAGKFDRAGILSALRASGLESVRWRSAA